MEEREQHKIAKTLSEYIKAIDNQGFNVKMNKAQDYDNLVLNELNILEHMSSAYIAELGYLSKCIRSYLWDNENSKPLYTILHHINLVMRTFAKILT